MSDEELYAQYLAETGHKSPAQPTARKTAQQFIDEGYASPDQIAAGANNAAAMMTGGLSKALPFMGRGVVTAALEGGAMGVAQAPHTKEDALKAFLTGGALQGGMAGAGKILGKAGDVGMQVAVNRKKYTPGVGTKLADEGLWGTEGMLKGQTQNALSKRGNQMQEIAQGIEGAPISARDIGGKVSDELAGPISGHGKIDSQNLSAADRPDLESIRGFTEDVMSRGNETMEQALARRAAAGQRAWRGKENPAQSLTGKLSKSEQKNYSQAIKGADPTGRMAEADSAYSALARARTGLEQEGGLPKSIMGVMSVGANKLPLGSLASSSVGQAGVKGGKLAEFLAPVARQAAVGKGTHPSPEELEEYEQYLRGTGQR